MNFWIFIIFFWIKIIFAKTIPCIFEFLGEKCENKIDSSFLLFSNKNFDQNLFLLPTDDSEAEMRIIKLSETDKNLQVLTFDPVRNFLYFFVKNKNIGQIRKISSIKKPSELVIENENLQNIRSMVVDPITGTIFIANGFLKTIEAISSDGKNRLTMISNEINPFFMVFHPILRILYFTDYKIIDFDIRQISMTNFESSKILIEKVGQITSLAIDYKNDRLFWGTETNFGGTIQSIFVVGDDFREQIIGSIEILPKMMDFFDGILYFTNENTKSIDVIDKNEIWTKLFKNLPIIEEFVVIRKEKPLIRDPCKNMPEIENAVCFLTEKFEITWNCKDEFIFDENSRKCFQPKIEVVSTTAETKFECNESEFECFEGNQCVSFAVRCDGIKNCNDGSDESPRICKFVIENPSNKTEKIIKNELQQWIHQYFYVIIIAFATILMFCVVVIVICCRNTEKKYKCVFTDQISPLTNQQTATTGFLSPPMPFSNHPTHQVSGRNIINLDQCRPSKVSNPLLPPPMPSINESIFEKGLSKYERKSRTCQNKPQNSLLSGLSVPLECSTPKSDVPPPRIKSGRYDHEKLFKPKLRSYSFPSSSSDDEQSEMHIRRRSSGSVATSIQTGMMPPMNSSREDS